MNRTIKFRAWDYKDGGMYQVSRIDFSGPNKSQGWVRLETEGEKDHPSRYAHDVEIMQFTGLLDKNGKELYEGDIVRHSGYKRPLQMSWIEGSYWLCRANGDYVVGTMKFDSSKVEIIGDIYSTPELLTQ
jgi:uncharacterized phage protein (TIGR01671 family)